MHARLSIETLIEEDLEIFHGRKSASCDLRESLSVNLRVPFIFRLSSPSRQWAGFYWLKCFSDSMSDSISSGLL